jgi:hypothetical protein
MWSLERRRPLKSWTSLAAQMDMNNIKHRSNAIGDAAVVTHRRVEPYASRPRGVPPNDMAERFRSRPAHREVTRASSLPDIISTLTRGSVFHQSVLLKLKSLSFRTTTQRSQTRCPQLQALRAHKSSPLLNVVRKTRRLAYRPGFAGCNSPKFRDDPHDAHARSVCMCLGSDGRQRGVHRPTGRDNLFPALWLTLLI